MRRKYVHWIKIPAMASSKDIMKLYEYTQKYNDAKVEVYNKSTGNLFDNIFRLTCHQNYNDLDLDCNTNNNSIRRLKNKPKNIIKSIVDFSVFVSYLGK